MKRSKIEWCDFSGGNLNFVRRGKDDCECSPGCDHCYARRIGERFDYLPDVTTFYPDKLAKLATQQFGCSQVLPTHPSPPLLFVCDTGDLFHSNVPFEAIRDAINMMASRKDVTWLILTKRAERMHDLFSDIVLPSWIWLGVTVVNQQEADAKIPLLLDTPAMYRFVSIEPMLEEIDLARYLPHTDWPGDSVTRCPKCGGGECETVEVGGHRVSCNEYEYDYQHMCPTCQVPVEPLWLDWVIAGCESGQGRRPADVAWFRSLRNQCQDAGVPFFLKQMDVNGQLVKMPLLDGVEWRQFPE